MNKIPPTAGNNEENKGLPTSWGNVASWYDELLESGSDSFQSKVILPNLVRILEPKNGMNVLDVACGQGYFSRAYASSGATVIASDISKELIQAAQKKNVDGGKGSVSYVVSPADELSFVKDASQDATTIILAIQNIENLQGVCGEVSRTLKSGGRFILVINHPMFRIPQRSGWGWDEKTSTQYRRVDGYMSDSRMEIDMTPGEENKYKKKYTISFHRPLQSYVKALNKSGLNVSRIEEWVSHKKSQKGPRQAEEDRTRKEIPMFMMIEAVKR